MKQIRTKAIIVQRTNYGEADRIIQFLTPEHGRISAIGKGLRKQKSRLSGALELFSVSEVTIALGRGEVGTITSARLDTFYKNILSDYDRLQFGYECIALVKKATESVSEPEFYELLHRSLAYLNELKIPLQLIEIWFRLQHAHLLGVGLNLTTTPANEKLKEDKKYNFDFSEMAFVEHPSGRFTSEHIKLLRLLQAKNPDVVTKVSGLGPLFEDDLWLVRGINP